MAAQIVLSPEESATINMWARGKRFPVRLVQRSQIILMAATGVLSQDIAAKLGTSRPTVQLW
ncbi:MAG: helix-turn-helix domain-containing protein, partial [Nitrospirae bacterium]|nr:helix-turn-helix domain-containing protein [Nitrospirota bacterium]